MILTIHQPVYIPWLGLIHKIALADKMISLDHVQFVAQDWISRNQIMTNNGPIWLTVPCQNKGRLESSIAETKIKNAANWQRKHWKSLMLNYKKAKYFGIYADFLEDLYKREWDTIAELNTYILRWMLKELGVNVTIESSTDYAFTGKKSELIQGICEHFKAKAYISGTLGRDYIDERSFEKVGIKVIYQDYHHPEYPQMHGEFNPYMSTLDLMFNCGPDSLDILMSGNLTRQELEQHLA